MYFFIGITGSIWFFRKKGNANDKLIGKLRGSVLYFLGLGLILAHYTISGSLVQLTGLFIIFRSFLPDIYDSFTRIPYVGKYLSKSMYEIRKLSSSKLLRHRIDEQRRVSNLICIWTHAVSSSVSVFEGGAVSFGLDHTLFVEWLLPEVVPDHLRGQFLGLSP